jgi:RNA polymerase sigma-70 factor (ECF subfamily)
MYAYSIAGTSTIAEDAIQETFIRAWRYLDSFRGTGSREGWLLRICRNAVYDLAARESKGVPASAADVVRLDQGHGHQTLAAFDGDPGQFGSDIVELVNQLPLIQREVLVLCGVLGYSYESASEVLDVPVGTVRSRLSRARRALEKMLAPGAEVA